MIRNIISDIECDKTAANTGGLVGGVIGAAAGAGFAKLLAYAALGTFGSLAIGAVGLGGICYSAVSWWNSSNRNKQIETHRIEIENYADALKQLLGHVQKGNWKYADSVLAQLNFDPKDYGTSVTMTNSGIKYSKLLEKEFNKKFKELENDLTKYVKNENKVLLLLEWLGEMLVTCLSLIFSDFHINKTRIRSIPGYFPVQTFCLIGH